MCLRDPNGIAQNDLQLHRLSGLPVQQHAGFRARGIPLRAGKDLVRRGQFGGKSAAEDPGHRGEDLIHAALQVLSQVRIAHHYRIPNAARQHGRRVHRPIDADLVPPDQLQARLVVILGVPQLAVLGQDACEFARTFVSSGR